MTKTSDDLTELFSALLPAEKRYVRLFARKHLPGEENNYLRLFGSLSRQDHFESSPSERNYLFNFILKAMRSFHECRNIDTQLRELLINSSFLLEKRLYRQSAKVLKRARELATRFGRHTILLDVIQLETQLNMEHAEKDPLKVMNTLHEETATVIRSINLDYQLLALQQRILLMLRTHHHIPAHERDSYNEQLDALLGAAKLSGRFDPLFYGLYARALYHHCCGEYAQSAAVYEELIALWETRPDRSKEERILYKRIVSNYLVVCHRLERFDVFPVMLDRMRTVPCKNAEEEAAQFQNLRLMELLYLMNTDGYDRLDRFAGEITEGLTRFRNKINKARELEFYHNLAVAYFINGEWRSALEWLMKIINAGKTQHRIDIQVFARVFRLLLWYETGKHDLLEYEPINVERCLRKQNSWNLFESKVTRLISKLIAAGKAERSRLFENFLQQLERDRQADQKFANTLGLEEVRYWATSHLESKSIREVMKTETSGEAMRESA